MPTLLNGDSFRSFLLDQFYGDFSCCPYRVYIGLVVEADSSISNKMVYVAAVYCENSGLLYTGPEVKEVERKVYEILDNLPKLIPGKIQNRNVAVKMAFPIHIDCYY
jgi:hypothetical protein